MELTRDQHRKDAKLFAWCGTCKRWVGMNRDWNRRDGDPTRYKMVRHKIIPKQPAFCTGPLELLRADQCRTRDAIA